LGKWVEKGNGSVGGGFFLLFKLLRGVANNLNGKNGFFEEINILKAIDSCAIRSGGETRAATVNSRGANDRSKGLGIKSGHHFAGSSAHSQMVKGISRQTGA
jgi:hypothetical protein